MNDKEKLKVLLLELFKSGEVKIVTEINEWFTKNYIVIDGKKAPICKEE
ncbi:hypothetical protein RGU74_21320 [Bacillus cereus]|nr:hypothetical protein [Bacillus cereus]MDR4986156.1 hypothetical protein [Bacillus cereus]